MGRPKKDFHLTMQEVLESTQNKVTEQLEQKKQTQSFNSMQEEQRCSFMLPRRYLEELRTIAFKETGRQGKRITIRAILIAALQNYFDDYNANYK